MSDLRSARLSLCMIVKDESQMLPGFLERVHGLWDELVVVDTGSADDTVAILEGAGAKVLHQAWRNDFAYARNYSLQAATCDWIIFLDPDEYVSADFVAQARSVLLDSQLGAATVSMQLPREDGHVQQSNLLRMFRRYPQVQFRHAIHEDVAESLMPAMDAAGHALTHIAAPILHHGYDKAHMQARGKKARDTSIMEASLRQDPDDLYLYFKLLEQARLTGDRKLARKVVPMAMAAWHRAPDAALHYWAGELAVMMTDALFEAQSASSLAQLESLALRVPDSPAIAYRRGQLLETLERLPEAQLAFAAALNTRGPVFNRQLRSVRPLMGLVRLAIATQDLDVARQHLQAARALAPEDPEVVFASSLL